MRDALISQVVLIKAFCTSQFPQKFVNLFFNVKEQVDGFIRELAFAKQLYRHFMCDKCVTPGPLADEAGAPGARDFHIVWLGR